MPDTPEPDDNPRGLPRCHECGDVTYRPDPVAGRRQARRCAGCHLLTINCVCRIEREQREARAALRGSPTMPDTLSREQWAEMRRFHNGRHLTTDVCDACMLVAHIDALTAAGLEQALQDFIDAIEHPSGRSRDDVADIYRYAAKRARAVLAILGDLA